MSKYTTELRYICETYAGLDESVGYNSIEEVIAKSRAKIFDFDYPIFDESYREVLETKIIRHFYTREIGFETVGLWKLKLNTKMNEIMVYYNQLYLSEQLEFNPLSTHSMVTENKYDNHNVLKNSGDIKTDNINKFSDTPQGALKDIQSNEYLTNATINENVRTLNDGSKSDGDGSSKTTSSGYAGTSGSKLLRDYRDTFINIDMMVIRDLEHLFMMVW